MKILAVIHGRAPMKDAVLRILDTWGATPPDRTLTTFVTTAHMSAFEQVSTRSDHDVVISAGGDGTNNEVVNAILSKPPDQRPHLCIMPLGSGNDFARMFPVRSPLECLEAIDSKNIPSRPIDVLKISSSGRDHYALNMITCGIGAEIAASVNRRKYSLPPAFNYYRAIIQWLLRYKSPTVSYTIDELEKTSPTLLAAFGNGTYAGNGLGLNPQSTIDDGAMGVTMIGDVGVIDFLRYQSTLKAADYVRDPRLHYSTARSASILVKKGSCAIETDGEPFVRLEPGQSADIELLPGAIRLI